MTAGRLATDWSAKVLEASLDAVVAVDDAGRVLYWNRAAEQMFGYSSEDATGRAVAELIVPPDLRKRHRIELERAGASSTRSILGRRVETRVMKAGGLEFPVELTVIRVSERPLVLTGLMRDLSPLQQAQDGRARADRLLSDAELVADIGSWELDVRAGELTSSDHLLAIYGLTREEVDPSLELAIGLVHPDDRERVEAEVAAVTPPGGRTRSHLEYRIVRPDGSVREVVARSRVESDERGAPSRWIGTLQDVTGQRLTERELQAHFAVSQALAEWEAFEEGVVGLLRRLGTALDFSVGSLWIPSAEGEEELHCRAFWSKPGLQVAEFEKIARSMALHPGVGAVGLAWETHGPVVVAGLTADPRSVRAAGAFEPVSGLAFPAVADAGPDARLEGLKSLAALSFYSDERRVPSERLIRTLTGIGLELGRFLDRRRSDLGWQPLTERELQVLRLAAGGFSGPAIAQELGVSPATVKSHFENLYEKLGVSDRASAVAHALRGGLIE